MGLEFDDRTAKKLEALYLSQDAIKRRRAVIDAVQPRVGEYVLDIGTGLGFVAYEMANQIGPKGKITGIDLSEPMLEIAAKRCSEMPWINFNKGDATCLPVEDSCCDAAVSVQVYEYVPEVMQALGEMQRVLKPGGRGAIVATDWKSVIWHSTVPDLTKQILAAWEQHCAYSDLPRTLVSRLKEVGLQVTSQEVIIQFNPSLNKEAYSYHILDLISDFAPGRNGLTTKDTENWAKDQRHLDKQGEYFFCVNQFLFLISK